MIILITGTPGSGKTLYGVNKLINDYIKTDRPVYCDIEGVDIDGVQKSPEDWRTTPERSIVIYDEAQQNDIFDARRRSRTVSDIVLDMDTHRHTAHDLIFITQSPKYLKSQILELVGEHYHLHRPYGASLASVYFWRRCESNPSSRTAQGFCENQFLFRYDKRLFNYYKSTVENTHKLKIPKKILFWCALPFIILFLLYRQFSDPYTQKMIKGGTGDTAPAAVVADDPLTSSSANPATVPPVAQAVASVAHETLRPAMIVASDQDCFAKNSYGELLDLTVEQCFKLSGRPSMLSSSRLNQNEGDRLQPEAAAPLPISADGSTGGAAAERL